MDGLLQALCAAVMEVEIQQADRRDDWRQRPADAHHEELHDKHEDCVHVEDVVSHNKRHDALVDEAGIRIQQGADDEERNELQRERMVTAC